MNYKVLLQESEEGFSVSCPGLPGCWSQGKTEEEALENIQDAIREYLAAVDDLVKGQDVREVQVPVYPCPRFQASIILMLFALSRKPGFASGTLIAQVLLRHKTRKPSFLLGYWFTVIVNCIALGVIVAKGVSPVKVLLGAAI